MLFLRMRAIMHFSGILIGERRFDSYTEESFNLAR